MTYSIGEIAEMLEVKPSTLRYYDKMGIFPNIKRVNGRRVFTDNDFKWLRVLKCMKKINMPVKKVCNMLTVIFVIVLSLVTFFNIDVYAAIATPGGGESGNSTSADWSKVKYVQMKAETLAYEESTGTNVLSTKWFNKEDVINRYKIYEVIENKGNRIKK